MQILIVGGFLGSGKTSVILNIAREYALAAKQSNVVIIENEIGEVGVDDKLLSETGLEVKNLFSGCVCCSLVGDIVTTIESISKQISPEMIIIESSGVGFPFNIQENIKNVLNYDSKIINVVDAKRWNRLFIPMRLMLEQQLKNTDYILVNKVDLVDDKIVDEVCGQVISMCPYVKVLRISATAGLCYEIINELLS